MAEPACPDEARLRAIFDQVEAHLERRYGIPVVITDVVAPFTGDRDGREIQIDHDQDVASAVFVLIHVFGHTVQWNLSARAREIGTVAQQQPTPELLESSAPASRTSTRPGRRRRSSASGGAPRRS